jgi:hypothetical protein
VEKGRSRLLSVRSLTVKPDKAWTHCETRMA